MVMEGRCDAEQNRTGDLASSLRFCFGTRALVTSFVARSHPSHPGRSPFPTEPRTSIQSPPLPGPLRLWYKDSDALITSLKVEYVLIRIKYVSPTRDPHHSLLTKHQFSSDVALTTEKPAKDNSLTVRLDFSWTPPKT